MKGLMCHSTASIAVCMPHAVMVPVRRSAAADQGRRLEIINNTKYIRLATDHQPRALRSSSYHHHVKENRPKDEATNSLAISHDHIFQVVVMRVSLHCQGCAGKVKKHLSKMEGVTSFSIDLESKRVTVMGHVSPSGVLESISKVINSLIDLATATMTSDNRIVDAEGGTTSRSRSHAHADDELLPYIHKVGVPPKQSLLKEFKFTFKETFFHDEPLKPFKDQTKSRKLLLGIEAFFPILDWGRRYKFSMIKGDVIAGLTIASLCIPQDIGNAKLANLDPQFGLYSSFVPPLIYAFMGSSRDIAIGPVAVLSLLLGSLLQEQIDPKHKLEYQRLAFTATFFAGITQFTLGFFRLGFLIDFLSHAAIVGFMAGAAITGKRNKKFFWVPAIAPLISVIVSTFCVFITRADKKGVQIVNHIIGGINPPSVHEIHFTGSYVATGFRIGAVAGMVALTEAVAIGRTFAAMKDYQLDGNKEMIALGTMNVVGSMTSCYVATGSFSRSAVNYMSGCNTAVSNIVMSLVVFLTLEVITPLFKYTPNAILASIIISAVVGLFDYEAMILIWKIDKFDFVACMGAFFGVVFISVEIGLLIAVVISFAKILLQVTRPRTAVLGKVPKTKVYRNIQQYPEAVQVPGVVIVRVDSAIYFSNSNYIRERMLRLITDEEEQRKENNQPRIKYLIIEMSPVTDIDTSGIHALEELNKSLEKKDIQLVLANPGQTVLEKLHASDFANTVGDDNIFLTVGDAILTLAPQTDP
ncbi:hypothetical protein RD792_001953 [Penstemon davidsonii]|uniref:Uncharacterized protein n=1 Tax=Penstemon davidsonii TaxID=160366 RepID=A0ABR0DPS7_9LAMI|nr:hypothetical protein RD792_001953 [Penstemon davidsonii]